MKNWIQHSANRKPDFWYEEAQKEIKEVLQVMAQQLSMKATKPTFELEHSSARKNIQDGVSPLSWH